MSASRKIPGLGRANGKPAEPPETPCGWKFAVVKAATPEGSVGLRLAATSISTGETWRHAHVLADTDANHVRLIALALSAAKAWAGAGWAPKPPTWFK